MKRIAFLAALCAAAQANDGIPVAEYKARRDALRRVLPDGVTILFGRAERDRGDLGGTFRQEPNFYYFSGWTEPGAALVIAPSGDALLLPKRSETRERYTGPKADPKDEGIAAKTGFDRVGEVEKWRDAIPAGSKIYGLPGAEHPQVTDATMAIARLRMVKSQAEIAALRRSAAASMEAHRAALARIAPGLYEYQIAATMSFTYFDQGCERHAYPPIVGSGPLATILHYNANQRRMDAGELVLMDVGAECSMYAADITRSAPVSGKFSARQKELYEIVLGAQNAAIAAAKPGMMLRGEAENSLERIVKNYLNAHGKDRNGGPLGKYLTHGLGHHVGLEVHDATDPTLALEAGNVVTIEPGLYIPEEGIGIRIEDMILITKSGAEVMTRDLAREPGDVERQMRKRGR